jgi:5-methylcytosine-specific restriction endonuclease McrA
VQEDIELIREALGRLEAEANNDDNLLASTGLSGLELPDIIRDVVDLLEPELKPYEFAFYMWLLRQSVIENDTQLIRVGRRPMQEGIIKSPSSKAKEYSLSYETVRKTFEGLESVGAIRQEGDTNREGTLFRVLLPEEIKVCQERRSQLHTQERVAPREAELDYYNVRENRLKVFERDNYVCTYCAKQLTRFSATLDHIHPVKEGGDNRKDNLVTACLRCNAKKNASEVSNFLAKKVYEAN